MKSNMTKLTDDSKKMLKYFAEKESADVQEFLASLYMSLSMIQVRRVVFAGLGARRVLTCCSEPKRRTTPGWRPKRRQKSRQSGGKICRYDPLVQQHISQ